MGGGCLFCAAWPMLVVGFVLGGFGCWIVAEQHDGDRSFRVAGWTCFALAAVAAALPFAVPALGALLR